MKRNLDTPVLRMDGKEYEDKPTFGGLILNTVTAMLPQDQGMAVEKKLQLYRLAQKVSKGGVVDFTTEELALAKERAGSALPPILMGPIFDLLETDMDTST